MIRSQDDRTDTQQVILNILEDWIRHQTIWVGGVTQPSSIV